MHANVRPFFDETWHGDAYLFPEPDVKLKFQLSTVLHGGSRNTEDQEAALIFSVITQ